MWASLNVVVMSFDDLGLPEDASDQSIWKVCQENEVVLVTANRNAAGPDSLETAIRDLNELTSLPVLTIANTRELTSNHTYAARVAQRLLEILFDLEQYLGAGRLYLP